MTDDYKVEENKWHKVSDTWGLDCQEGSLINNIHRSQVSSSLEGQRKGKRLTKVRVKAQQ